MKRISTQLASALALIILGSGCGQKAAPTVSPTTATSPASQDGLKRYIESNPNMPPQERAALQKQMQHPSGPTTH